MQLTRFFDKNLPRHTNLLLFFALIDALFSPPDIALCKIIGLRHKRAFREITIGFISMKKIMSVFRD